jgi:hypothetical protein
MNRSLLLGLIATILIFSGIAIYFYFTNIKQKYISPAEAVPNDAYFIFQTGDFVATWNELNETSFWKDVKTNELVGKLSNGVQQTIELLAYEDLFQTFFNESEVAVSLHTINNQLGLLYIVRVDEETDYFTVATELSKKLNAKVVARKFERIPVYDVVGEKSEVLYSLSGKDGLLMVSTYGTLVEESIRKLKYQLPNPTRGFEQVKILAEANADANLYVNYQKVTNIWPLFLKPEYTQIFEGIGSFANWSMLDLGFNKDEISLSGVTVTDDSTYQFLDLFKNQTPKTLSLFNKMPKSTSFVFQMGFSDYPSFHSELKEYLQARAKLNGYQNYADSIGKRYQIDLKEGFLPLIDGEAALMMIEPLNSSYEQNLAAFIRFKNPDGMQTLLKSFVRTMDIKGEADSVTIFHQELEIERVKLGNFLKLYYGEIMESIVSPYLVRLDDVFVFANDINTLKKIIDDYKSNNTLENDETFSKFQPKLTSNCNISIYINPAKNFLLPTNFVTDSFFSTLNIHQNYFRRFEGLSIQYANTANKVFVTQVNYLYKPTNANETQLLWNYKLDTTLATQPYVVFHVGLKQNIIFAQDVKNTLYCINQSGGLIWKSRLNARLVGSVKMLDPLQNGKICYFFSTEKQANLIDENGVSLYNYPINYPGKAIADPFITDQYGDSNYVVFVSLENARIMAYQLNGKPLTGWMPKHLTAKPEGAVAAFKYHEKVGYYVVTSQHKLVLMDAAGKTLHQSVNGITWATFKSFNASSQCQFTAVDTAGKLCEIYFDTLFKSFTLTPNAKSIPYWKYEAGFGINEPFAMNLFKGSMGYGVYNPQFDVVFQHNLTDTFNREFAFNQTINGKVMVMEWNAGTGACKWLDAKGSNILDKEIISAAPFYAGKLFLDQRNYLIGGDKNNNIFVYRLR